MSVYRNELEAAQHRIVELEGELEHQASELQRLQRAVQKGNEALDELRRRFDGTPVASRKRWVWLLLLLTAILATIGGALVIIDARVEESFRMALERARSENRELEEARRQTAELRRQLEAKDKQILADPLDPPVKIPETAPIEGRFDEATQKKALHSKAVAGDASEGELRMLRAICMNDGDRACRNLAIRRLAELSQD